MFKIGEFSIITHVSIRMLRYYDEIGLLKPKQVDKYTNYRLYSSNQIFRLNKIIALRDMGFLTAEILELIESDNETLLKKLNLKKQEITNNIINEKQKITKIENLLKNMEKECYNMNFEVKIKTIPAYNVISLREIIPSYEAEGLLWEKLCRFIDKNNIKPLKDDVSFAMYHDKGYKENDVDVEVVTAVDKLGKTDGEFVFKQTEEISCAACIMVAGPYSNLKPAYYSLAKWIEDNGYSIAGINRQVCIKGAWNESDEQNYLNEIQFPVKKSN